MKRSGIITLLTDFGLADPYVAMMKGVVLSINRSADLIDITHNIRAGSVSQGSEILNGTWPCFPEGTVHAAVVDPGVGSERRPVAVKAAGHFFVGPDNGIFWPVIKTHPDAVIVELTEKRYFLPDVSNTFHGRDVFAPVAAHISLGIEINRLGPTIIDPEKLKQPHPCQKDGILSGQITRIDNFGNLITNIPANTLKDFLGDKRPVIHIDRYKIPELCRTYSDKHDGELTALVNSSSYLEIAVNRGKASEYLGMSPDEIIGISVRIDRKN